MKDVMSAAEFRAMMAKREQGRNNKFGAVPTPTGDGKMFASIWEATFYKTQWVLMQLGEVERIDVKPVYELIVNHVVITRYELDFRITLTPKSPDWERYQGAGGIRYVDTKSSATITEAFRIKQKLMLALFNIVVEAVFDPATRPEKNPRKRSVKK